MIYLVRLDKEQSVGIYMTVETDVIENLNILLFSFFSDQFCGIQKLEIKDAFTKWQESWGITSFVEEVYMLKPK